MSNLVVLTFDDPDEAGKVRQALGRLERDGLLDLEDAAVAVRDREGKFHVHNQVADAVKLGAFGGAFAGLLLGIMFPVAGIALGAAGGALLGGSLDSGVEEDFVEEVAQALQPGTSALFLVVRSANARAALAALQQFKGTVYHTSLDPEAEESLRHALRGRV